MAITLDVFTKVSEQSLRTSSNLIEQTLTKSGQRAGEDFGKALASGIEKSPQFRKQMDTLADAIGKVRVEQEKLDAINAKSTATDAQKIAQAERLAKAQRDVARMTDDAARSLDKTRTSAQGLMSVLANLSAGTRFGGIIADADMLAGKFGGVGVAAGGAIAGIAAIGVAAVALTKQAYDLGKMWDDVGDTITARTGIVGDELTRLTDQVGDVAGRTAASIQDISTVFGQSMQSLRLSGGELEFMTQKIVELNNLTGEQTNIRQLGMLFRTFNVDAQEQFGVLNGLYDMFQKTGIPVNTMIETLSKAGPVLNEFGMDVVQAAGFVAVFEEAGISFDSAIKGLKFSLKNLSEAGVDPAQGLQQIITEIQDLIASGDELGARDLAEQRFGKSFPEILRAIRENRIDIQALPGEVDTVTDSIGDSTKATEDFTEEWKKFKNFWADTLKPVVADVFSFINDRLTDTTEWMIVKIGEMTQAWSDFTNGDWFGPDTGFGRILSFLGLGPDPMLGGGGAFDNTPVAVGVPNFPRTGGEAVGPGSLPNAPIVPGTGSGYNIVDWSKSMVDQFDATAGTDLSITADRNGPTGAGVQPGDKGHPKDKGLHNVNRAVDIGGSVSEMTKFANWWVSDPARVASTMELIYDAPGFPSNKNIKDGKFVSGPSVYGNQFPLHKDHVHLALQGVPSSFGAGIGASPTGPQPGAQAERHGNVPVVPVPSVPDVNAPAGPGGGGGSVPGGGGYTGGGSAPSGPPVGFPSAAEIGPASPNLAPVQMVPSPFGPTYGSVPAGSTPGYNDQGKPGYYQPDPKRIESSTRRYEDSLDRINEANDRITEAKQRAADAATEAAQVEKDLYSTAEERKRAQDALKRANDAVDDAIKNRDRVERDANTAMDELSEAKLGTFRENQKAAQARKNALGDIGAPLADDFGLSEGLPGIAKWLTTFVANLALAPMTGQLAAQSAASPIQGGFGMFGMVGANNIAAGNTPLGLSSGATPYYPSIGPAPLGGAVGAPLPAPVGPATTPGPVGPATPNTSQQPAPGAAGAGFQGIGGLPLAAAEAGAAAADIMAPGTGQAAQTGLKLANRAAAFTGQLAGIGVGGLMETLLPNDSPLADPSKSWLGRIAAGFAGARPALPNTAGGEKPAQTPEEAAALQAQNGGGQANGPMVQIENLVNQTPDGGQQVAAQIGRQQLSMYASGGPR